jgi:hypothetical protein
MSKRMADQERVNRLVAEGLLAELVTAQRELPGFRRGEVCGPLDEAARELDKVRELAAAVLRAPSVDAARVYAQTIIGRARLAGECVGKARRRADEWAAYDNALWRGGVRE